MNHKSHRRCLVIEKKRAGLVESEEVRQPVPLKYEDIWFNRALLVLIKKAQDQYDNCNTTDKYRQSRNH